MFSFGGLDEALKLLRVCWSVSALKILDCEANLLFPVLPPAVCRQSRTLFFFFPVAVSSVWALGLQLTNEQNDGRNHLEATESSAASNSNKSRQSDKNCK